LVAKGNPAVLAKGAGRGKRHVLNGGRTYSDCESKQWRVCRNLNAARCV